MYSFVKITIFENKIILVKGKKEKNILKKIKKEDETKTKNLPRHITAYHIRSVGEFPDKVAEILEGWKVLQHLRVQAAMVGLETNKQFNPTRIPQRILQTRNTNYIKLFRI